MRRVEVEAFQDETHPEGGHAVIMLRGIASLADGRFRLRPVEGGGDGGPMPPWGDRELKALSVETRNGCAGLIVGPELTDSPALQPGLPLEILVPSLAARGEFLWPAVTPPARPKRRSIVARKAAEAAQQSVAAAAGKSAAASTSQLPVPASQEEIANAIRDMSVPHLDTIDFVEFEPSPAKAQEEKAAAPRADAVTAAKPAGNGSRPAARPPTATPSSLAKVSEMAERKPPSSSPAQSKSAASAVSQPETIAADGPSTLLPPASAHGVEHDSEPSPSSVRAREAEATPPPSAAGPGTPAAHVSQLAAHEVAATQHKPMSRAGLLASALTGVLVFQLASLLWYDVRIVKRGAPSPAPAVVAVAKAPAAPAGTSRSQPLIYDALTSGSVSPRGVAAEGVSPARSLERAHALLHGAPGQRDTEEGLFWLKHHLASALGGERTRIVLTQLGSAYAEPSSGQPDFAKARAVWELAAAYGDPVAMCFLAAVHERGLGVTADTASAKEWLGRARAAGGSCITTGSTQPSGKR